MHVLGRRGGVFSGPFGLVVEYHGHTGLREPRSQNALVGQFVQIGAQLAHVAEYGGILARVGHHAEWNFSAPALDCLHWK